MQDKKNNEENGQKLDKETLGKASGGIIDYNPTTKKYEVYDEFGKFAGSYKTHKDALKRDLKVDPPR